MTRERGGTGRRESDADPGPGAASAPDAVRDDVLEMRGLTKRYGDSLALSDVSIALERGSITGLLGANGAGKTTLLKSILGLVTPTEGTVVVRAREVATDVVGVHDDVAAVFEGARNVYWRLTARENVSLFARLHGVTPSERPARIDGVLETVDLVDEADTRAGELSRGMKQRCALACALVRDAPILLLDEPTLGLDRASRSALLGLLEDLARDGGRTILLSSHDMDVVERLCDRAVVLESGRIVTDASVAALKSAFSTRTYTVTLAETVDEASVSSVIGPFELLEHRTSHDLTEVDLVLPTPDDVYVLVDRLRHHGSSLRSLERTEPDLGSIFAELTNDAEATA